MAKLKVDIHKRYKLLGSRKLSARRIIYTELRRFGIFLIALAAVKAVVMQGVYLYLGYGLQWWQLKADAVQLAVICAVFAGAYGLLRVYIRLHLGRYTLADESVELRVDRDEIIYSCALKKGKRLNVHLPKREIYAVQRDRERLGMFSFSGRFNTEVVSADGTSSSRRSLKKFALPDIFEPDLCSELIFAEYI